MKKSHILHIFAILLVLFALGFGVRSFLFAQNDGGSLVSLNDGSVVDNSTEKEILSLLLELRSIKLDVSMFESSAFKALKDFGVTLDPEPVSRPNPFAPIGSDETVEEVGGGSGTTSSIDDGDDLGDVPAI